MENQKAIDNLSLEDISALIEKLKKEIVSLKLDISDKYEILNQLLKNIEK